VSTFLSSMLSGGAAETPAATPAVGNSRTDRVQARYAKVFKDANTAARAADAMGKSHVGVLNQIYRYEKLKLIHRLPESEDAGRGGRSTLWKWVGKNESAGENVSVS